MTLARGPRLTVTGLVIARAQSRASVWRHSKAQRRRSHDEAPAAPRAEGRLVMDAAEHVDDRPVLVPVSSPVRPEPLTAGVTADPPEQAGGLARMDSIWPASCRSR